MKIVKEIYTAFKELYDSLIFWQVLGICFMCWLVAIVIFGHQSLLTLMVCFILAFLAHYAEKLT
jgi:Mg2+ and Co2+ transporter CorA